MSKLVLLLLATLAASFVAAETAYFAFKTHGSSSDFVFQLADDKKIAVARKILSGEEGFFDIAIEVCDASLPYTNDYLDKACGAFLPGCFYCPWSFVLTKEVKM